MKGAPTLRVRKTCAAVLLGTLAAATAAHAGDQPSARALEMGELRDVCVVLSLPAGESGGFVTDLARRDSTPLVLFRSPRAAEVAEVREAALAAGLLGQRVFADHGDWTIPLADNVAGLVLVGPAAREHVSEEELLRVLHPGGRALVGGRELVKKRPEGTDAWSHPYHGPDNNPQSTDELARAPYLTQFLADPKFSPMPEVSVAAGGRVFRAFGHIAHKANQNAMLNTLIAVNAYNGIILWQRKLSQKFMIHRNAMVATPETLYLADSESCKLLDARTGQMRDEIVAPASETSGGVWKWMALQDGVLYALVGGPEVKISTQRSQNRGLGHWPWGMWAGHDYKDPSTNFGFGRTFVALDPATKKVLWSHREEDYLDSRGVCMKNGRIYFCAPEKLLGCLDATTGNVRWRNSDSELLEAIGPNERAQHYVTGYATTTYIKCTDEVLLFAGPQRSRLVAASAADGKLLWQRPHGNLQLVLREDALYAAGPGQSGVKLAYATGEKLGELPTRRACTRATGSIDSIFYRTTGGTVRVDVAANTAQHIAPMRPPCQDGVIISDGMLFWGPWMCGCQLSLYGHIGLSPAGDFHSRQRTPAPRLEVGPAGTEIEGGEFVPRTGDWPTYGGDNRRSSTTRVAIPAEIQELWRWKPPSPAAPTAPVTAGGAVFVADRSGVVRAVDANGTLRWRAATGGAIYFPPALADGRAFVGSADGRVYALDAATGRLLWRFRVAPAERWIPVYGTLISTWPVAGGVVVEDGVVYAAAGIAHYDGTHVVALDASTGKLRWHNGSSGTLSPRVQSGISLQGDLYLEDGELRFLGGGVYRVARFRADTGECLNEPHEGVNSRFQTAFYAYYPGYAQYSSLRHALPGGKLLSYDASYEGSQHTSLTVSVEDPDRRARDARRSRQDRRGRGRKNLWEFSRSRFHGFVVSSDTLVAVGRAGDDDTGAPFVAAIRVADGATVWRRDLPKAAVRGGVAVDHDGRIVVSLEDGHVLCLGAVQTAGGRRSF